jgi:ATP-dependent exoDNAse (exonuclease V) alpha subunit
MSSTAWSTRPRRASSAGRADRRWDAQRRADPDKTRIILTHTNAEVRDLNQAARERLRDAGELGQDVRVSAERGARDFASGDRIMFLKNERGLA